MDTCEMPLGVQQVGDGPQARLDVALADAADLPGPEQPPRRSRMILDTRLLCILLCVHPLAGLVYWMPRRCQATLQGKADGE